MLDFKLFKLLMVLNVGNVSLSDERCADEYAYFYEDRFNGKSEDSIDPKYRQLYDFARNTNNKGLFMSQMKQVL